MTDLENLMILPSSDLPEHVRKYDWEKLFRSIPKGKMAILPKEIRRETIASVIKRLHKKGKYLDFYFTTRQHIGYLVHHKGDLKI